MLQSSVWIPFNRTYLNLKSWFENDLYVSFRFLIQLQSLVACSPHFICFPVDSILNDFYDPLTFNYSSSSSHIEKFFFQIHIEVTSFGDKVFSGRASFVSPSSKILKSSIYKMCFDGNSFASGSIWGFESEAVFPSSESKDKDSQLVKSFSVTYTKS